MFPPSSPQKLRSLSGVKFLRHASNHANQGCCSTAPTEASRSVRSGVDEPNRAYRAFPEEAAWPSARDGAQFVGSHFSPRTFFGPSRLNGREPLFPTDSFQITHCIEAVLELCSWSIALRPDSEEVRLPGQYFLQRPTGSCNSAKAVEQLGGRV